MDGVKRSKKTVLITGGNGFIGSHVGEEFLVRGWDVVILGKAGVEGSASRPGVTRLLGRVGDKKMLEQAFALGIDGVVHLASSTGPANADTGFDVSSNLGESLELLECCVKYGVKKVVLASSGGTVYGIPRRLPITEESATNPICSYGIVKLAMEKYWELYGRMHGLESVVLRISNPYGPGQNPNRSQGVIAVFAAKMLEGKQLTLWGDGQVVRDFVHVRDLARLFCLAIESPATGVFNAGSGVGLSMNDLIEVMGTELKVKPDVQRLAGRACDVPASVLSCRKARETFGWVPEISMEQGIRQVGSWLRNEVLPPAVPPVYVTQIAAVREGTA